MPRFSAKAKEIWDEIWYNTDIVKAKSLLKELDDPLDIAFGKIWISGYLISFQRVDELLELLSEIENENKQLNDQFIQFQYNYLYCLYFSGWNSPVVSKEQAEKYLDNIEQTYQDIDYKDDWEKYYIIGRYYFSKAFYEFSVKKNYSNAIKIHKMCIETWSKIPQDGKYYSRFISGLLGVYNNAIGNFEEAEKLLNRALVVTKKHNNLWQLWILGNLSWLSFTKGDLQKANEWNEQRIAIAMHYDSINGIYLGLTTKGFYLYQEGNYDESLEFYQASLENRKQHGDPLQIFWGYFRIFYFNYSRFKVTKDKAFLNQAEQTFTDLQKLSMDY
ncbi:MAG: tetratricopeptide repeat protein, partial [Candidatus Kariarchaeaceae archaeon]